MTSRPAILPLYAEGSSDEERAQLAVDMMQPTHTVSFLYPIYSLVQGESDKTDVIVIPVNRTSRWPYENLIDDESIQENSSQVNEFESSFFLVNQIDVHDPDFKSISTSPARMSRIFGGDGLVRLLHDVDAYRKTVGKTKLQIMTFRHKKNPPIRGSLMIRVKRTSMAVSDAGRVNQSTHSYEFSIQRLLTYESAGFGPVAEMLLHVISRKSTRAMRHVAHQLRVMRIEEPQAAEGFKPPRTMPFLEALSTVLVHMDRESLPKDQDSGTIDTIGPDTCSICLDPFVYESTSSHCPVRARNCPHIFCYGCLAKRVSREESERGRFVSPRCPLNCNLLRERELRTFVTRERDGTFFNLPNFTPHENFEFSCADLDVEKPVSRSPEDERCLFINAQVMEHGLDLLIGGALLEDPDSTPYNLQTIRFAETQLAIYVVRAFLGYSKGYGLRYGELRERIRSVVCQNLVSTCKDTMYSTFLGSEDKKMMTAGCWTRHPELTPTRQGFWPFLDRLIHRMLMFQVVRECKCSPGFHNHGARVHWNPEQFPVNERLLDPDSNLPRSESEGTK